MSPIDPQREPVVPPEVVDPPPGGDEPIIPEPDPTHTPVIPPKEPSTNPQGPERPAEPQPTGAAHRQRETDESWPVIGTGVATSAMVKGAFGWAAVGAAVGLVVGALIALVPFTDLAYPARFGIVGIAAALAGATAGGLYGGGRRPELEEDVGNQIGPAPLFDKNTDPEYVREATEDKLHERRDREAAGRR